MIRLLHHLIGDEPDSFNFIGDGPLSIYPAATPSANSSSRPLAVASSPVGSTGRFEPAALSSVRTGI